MGIALINPCKSVLKKIIPIFSTPKKRGYKPEDQFFQPEVGLYYIQLYAAMFGMKVVQTNRGYNATLCIARLKAYS